MKIDQIMQGSYVVEVNKVSFLAGCPSEVSKAIMIQKKTMPTNIILSHDGYRGGVIQNNPEFPLLNFLFINKGFFRGEKMRIIAEESQIPGIKENLYLGLLMPDRETLIDWEIPIDVIEAQEKITRHLALKKPDGSIIPIDDMVEFIPFENGVAHIEGVEIKVSGRNVFTFTAGKESMPVDLNFYGYQKPPIPIIIPEHEIRRSAFGAIALSHCTSGFDPSGYTTGFLLMINSQPIMVDGVPWTKEHLRALGFHTGEIVAYIMSHIHEDHASIIESIINGKCVNLITTREIFYSFARKVANVIGWKEEKIRDMVNFHEVTPGTPFLWYGAAFNFFRTIHPIFTIGFDVKFQGKRIVYSGDTMWGEQLRPLLENSVISQEQFEVIDKIPREPADLIIVDGAGGTIHPDPLELNKLPLEQKGATKITHRSSLPEGVSGLETIKPGQMWELVPEAVWSVGSVYAIANSPIIKELDPGWFSAILSQGSTRKVPIGETVLEEGMPGKNFYIILNGAFSVAVNGEEVAKLGTGDFFGEISIMGNIPCTATVTAISSGRILEIPRKIFLGMATTTNLGERLRKIHRIRPILLKCGWMKNLPPEIINRITEKTEERFYPAGEKIVVQGEIGSEFFLIRSGRVQILVEQNGLHAKNLATLFTGQFFGEMALLGNGKRVASSIAETDVSVLILKKKDFDELVKEVPALQYTLGTLAEEREKEL